MLFRRIPFEEWGLKSVPSLKKKDQEAVLSSAEKGTGEGQGTETAEKVEVMYPRLYQSLCNTPLLETIKSLAEGRRDLHRSRRNWSLIAMPLTTPFALLPVIPNLPFFYVTFRAWSHHRALSGIQHINHLVEHSLLRPTPSPTLDSLYTLGLLHPTRSSARQNSLPDATNEQSEAMARDVKGQIESGPGKQEVMLLHGWNGKLIAERLELPGLEVEIERAVEQVEKSIKTDKEEVNRDQLITDMKAQNNTPQPSNAMHIAEGKEAGQVRDRGPLYDNARPGK
ncbi:MAG: hypothetical protein M1828_001175 [Chrysothrix sp. TS-e1954]|nr:MAG: hypothetical protein M1828_001175 [Chrysothrix sp. TS-e1954]